MYTALCASNAIEISSMTNIRVINFNETLWKFLVRFSMMTLGKSNDNCNGMFFTVSIFEVLNNFCHITASGVGGYFKVGDNLGGEYTVKIMLQKGVGKTYLG